MPQPTNDVPEEDGQPAPSNALRGSYLQSLEKGLAVLAAFRAANPSRSASEIAEAAGLDRASTRRVLLTLVQLGYVAQQGRRFGLTAKVLDFGHEYLSGLPFATAAHPVLEELSDQLNETVSIGVLEGRDVVFILRVPAKRLLTFDLGVGGRVPAHLHSMGHVILAAMKSEDIEEFAREVEYRPLTEHSISTPEALIRGLQAARSFGWALTQRQYEPDLGGISVPLADARGNVMAAINVSFVVDRDSELRAVNDILPRLKIAARRLEQAMGDGAALPLARPRRRG